MSVMNGQRGLWSSLWRIKNILPKKLLISYTDENKETLLFTDVIL